MPWPDKEPRPRPGELTEHTLLKWKIIQMAAILPLTLSVVFLFKFRGSITGVIMFFLMLIVGVILPQVYRDFIQSHLLLKEEIRSLKEQITEKSSP
jgi:hypothetical protein